MGIQHKIKINYFVKIYLLLYSSLVIEYDSISLRLPSESTYLPLKVPSYLRPHFCITLPLAGFKEQCFAEITYASHSSNKYFITASKHSLAYPLPQYFLP